MALFLSALFCCPHNQRIRYAVLVCFLMLGHIGTGLNEIHTEREREGEREPKLCQEKSNGSIQIIVAVQQEKLKTNKNLYIVILTTVRFDMCYYMLWNSLVNFDSSISLCRGDGALYSFVCAFVPSHLCALSVWHGPCQWAIGLMHIASITL